jgi:(1->4)-alpha-D-glucan 1-alpha-D-glucosylmutase
MTDGAIAFRPRFVPASTYRLQVHGGFTLHAARDIVPYLRQLGVDAAYTSPYFAAHPGSTHGYDVSNHNEVSVEVGGSDALAAFTDTLREHGLQHIVDFVPNHMGIATSTNPWWRDVLENGPSARAGRFFDIDWFPVKRELRRKLLLPILGDQYGRVLERGELQLEFRDGRILLKYFDAELPINPRQSPRVYRAGLDELTELLGASNPDLLELVSVVTALQKMPPYTDTSPDAVAERHRESVVAQNRLRELTSRSPRILEHIQHAVQVLNGTPGDPSSFNRLHDLLEEQVYRLSYWRTASHEINYRRFFDINSLAGLRVEDPDVFAAIHQLVRTLLAEGRVTGLRIDHVDGLFDPARYVDAVQDLAAEAWGSPRAPGACPLYVVVEKILSDREQLPSGWPVHGTTGYNFLNQVNGLFVDAANARRMRRVYSRLIGATASFPTLLYESKRLIMDTSMASELNVLADMLNRISESNRKSRDFTLNSLRDVIVEVVACFPTYRTYITTRGWTPEDRAVIAQAIARARRRNPAVDPTIFDFLREVLLPRDPDVASGIQPELERREGYPPADASEAAERLRFAMKFQQYTGPLQAKGLEDTAFYRYNLLLSLNEVGGDPSRVGVSPKEFHQLNQKRRLDWPFEMLSTATHDTKVGEDVRTRIDVLSEMPEDWGREVARWMRLNRGERVIIEGEPVPDRNDEYRFYQALIGVWPPEVTQAEAASPELIARLQAYMTKSVKEAKLHSSWINPNEEYESGVTRFVARVLSGEGGARFLPAFLPFQQRIARIGFLNSLAQVVLKTASPGIPDIYQGTELWDLHLVDPDNRLPVDFDRRRHALSEVQAMMALPCSERADTIGGLLARWTDGTIKMFVTAAGLRLRREAASLFLEGDYTPLDVEVSVPADIVAFARVLDGQRALIVVVPRLLSRLMEADGALPVGECWKTSRVLLPATLAGRSFRDAFTGSIVRPENGTSRSWLFVGQVLQTLPVAMLVDEDGTRDAGSGLRDAQC